MDLLTRKIHFIQEFLKLKNEALISQMEQLLKKEKNKLKDEPMPMTLEEFKNRINRSLKDADENKLTEVDELINNIQKWD